ARELDALGSQEERRAEAERSLDAARDAAARAAGRLRAARRAAGAALEQRVSEELAALGMQGAHLRVALADRPAREGDDAALVFDGKRLGEGGCDQVEFLLQANPGEEPRGLQRVASGG